MTDTELIACRLFRLSVPMIAQNLCGFGLQTVGIVFISRLGVAQVLCSEALF